MQAMQCTSADLDVTAFLWKVRTVGDAVLSTCSFWFCTGQHGTSMDRKTSES